LRWLLDAEVSEVVATLATHVKERPDGERGGEMRAVTSDDEANLLLNFADGEITTSTTGTISLSVVESGRPEHRVEIFGSLGALRIEGNGELFNAPIGANSWQPIQTERGELASGMSDNEWSRGFTTVARKIVEALQEGRTTVEGAATFDDGHRTQLVLDAARRSHESNCRELIKI
jgi:predicted dehydrogenase